MFDWLFEHFIATPIKWVWKKITGADFDGGEGISQSELDADDDDKISSSNTIL